MESSSDVDSIEKGECSLEFELVDILSQLYTERELSSDSQEDANIINASSSNYSPL